jgi:hypothetical protein
MISSSLRGPQTLMWQTWKGTCYLLHAMFPGSGLDPDSIRSVDPDPDSESGSISRRAKMTYIKKFRSLKCWMLSCDR